MSSETNTALDFYAKYGVISDPGRFAEELEKLPLNVSQLCSVVQGLLIHIFWAERYGEKLTQEREAEAGIRHIEQIFAAIKEKDDAPLTTNRQLHNRFVGNCRTFSVLLASMLQSQGTPARARCGFAKYFKPDWFEDHWVCEYWNVEQARWIMVDAQLDEFQCQELDIRFDPMDVPGDQFIVGGKAWLACRNDEADPDQFGIFEMHGLWFVRGNLVRDIAALNKMELLPWDGWGLINREDKNISRDELVMLDDVASATFDEIDFFAVHNAYKSREGLTVPPVITSFTRSGPMSVDLLSEKGVQ